MTDSRTVLFFLFPGICKLINNGSYIAAFPPHEVISILKKSFSCSLVTLFFFLSLATSLRRIQSMSGPGPFSAPIMISDCTLAPVLQNLCAIFPLSGVPAPEGTQGHGSTTLTNTLCSNTEFRASQLGIHTTPKQGRFCAYYFGIPENLRQTQT